MNRESIGIAVLLALVLAIGLSMTGCAQMFTAKTKASWSKAPDGTLTIYYESDKEQVGLDAEVDPSTGKFHVKVDKASTQDSVVAATLQMQGKWLDLVQSLAAASKTAATKGATIP